MFLKVIATRILNIIIMEMFISFFTGKVMLFYGISLIMKEKSNASALTREQRRTHLGLDSGVSGSRDERIWDLIRARLGAEALTKIRFELAKQVFRFQGDIRNP